MFTGLVRDLGKIVSVSDKNDVRKFGVVGRLALKDLGIGASVSHSGVCLTVIDAEDFGDGACRWSVEAVPETLAKTTLSEWEIGRNINLEPSLRLGDELGGHLVFGHVDGLGKIRSITPEGDSRRIAIDAPDFLLPLIAQKGSVCVDGISLTIAKTVEGGFEVAVIPHTWDVTSLGQTSVGSEVNLEADMLARYVERQLAFKQ